MGDKIGPIAFSFLMGFAFTVGTFYGTSLPETKRESRLQIHNNEATAQLQRYDLTRDGIDDIITKNGNISVGQGNGEYVPLENIAKLEFVALEDKYRLDKGEDGRYYTRGVVSGLEK